MDISAKLNLNWQRNTDWKTFTPENARPAIYAFDGDVYTGVCLFDRKVRKVTR
jgi:cytoplasmic iron level regulating protein YaaA (DUF328/UPF0246 family)